MPHSVLSNFDLFSFVGPGYRENEIANVKVVTAVSFQLHLDHSAGHRHVGVDLVRCDARTVSHEMGVKILVLDNPIRKAYSLLYGNPYVCRVTFFGVRDYRRPGHSQTKLPRGKHAPR